MPKDIAVVSYNLSTKSSLTQDAVVIRDTLNSNGYDAELVFNCNPRRAPDQERDDKQQQVRHKNKNGDILQYPRCG